jgi:hypothetical protein
MSDELHHLADEQGELNDSVAGVVLAGRLRRDETVAYRGLEVRPVRDDGVVFAVFAPRDPDPVELLNARAVPTASALLDRLDGIADRQAPTVATEAD